MNMKNQWALSSSEELTIPLPHEFLDKLGLKELNMLEACTALGGSVIQHHTMICNRRDEDNSFIHKHELWFGFGCGVIGDLFTMGLVVAGVAVKSYFSRKGPQIRLVCAIPESQAQELKGITFHWKNKDTRVDFQEAP